MTLQYKLILLTFFIISGSKKAFSQEVNSPAILKIGDQCPDFEFANIINYPGNAAKLSDFKGKLVILDFWATWCGPCIATLPKLDSLQKIFGDSIQILPISYEKKEAIEAFFKKSKRLQGVSLPWITEDTTTRKSFPFNTIPHEVWIDKEGKLIATTSHDEITAANIAKYIAGERLDLTMKVDLVSKNFKIPLLFGGLGEGYQLNKKKLMNSSTLLHYIPGLSSRGGAPNVYGDIAISTSTNVTIAQLYQAMLASVVDTPRIIDRDFETHLRRLPARTIWEARDSSLFNWLGRSRESWKSIPDSVKLFCYEIVAPKKDYRMLNTYGIEDLNRYFGEKLGIEGLVEKRRVPCWVLLPVKDKGRLSTKGEKPDIIIDKDLNKVAGINYSIKGFLFWWLSMGIYLFPTPIIDESGFSDPIDLDVAANPEDFEAVRKALYKKYGLEFELQERELDMIVIRDKK